MTYTNSSYGYGRSPKRIKRPNTLTIVLTTLILVASGGVLAWLWGQNLVHWFTTTTRESYIFWVPVLAGLAAFGFGVINVGHRVRPLRRRFAIVSMIAGVALVILGIVLGVGAEYQRKHILYENATKNVEQVAPDYADRAPYEVADKVSAAEMQDLTGDASSTKALSDRGDHGMWNTVVFSRGLFEGYEAVQEMDLSLYDGKNTVTNCRFSDNANLRDHGWLPHNNLSRAIYEQVPLDVDFNSSDIYGYCDGDTPHIVIPLTQAKGFWYPVYMPFGVAVYNGETGELRIADTEKEIAAIPGAVYPQSLAATQREALAANEGWYEMVVAGTSGYTAASANTEVQLNRAGSERGDFVTTLTPRGSSKSIVGVSYVEATAMVPGKWNTLTVATLPDGQTRASNKALTDSLRGRYSHITDIATDSLQVFEVTSATDGKWVLTLGRELAVSYRAYVSADGEEITLVNRQGKTIAQTYTDEDEGDTTSGDGELVPVDGADLEGLTSQELTDLGKAIMDELSRRASAE